MCRTPEHHTSRPSLLEQLHRMIVSNAQKRLELRALGGLLFGRELRRQQLRDALGDRLTSVGLGHEVVV